MAEHTSTDEALRQKTDLEARKALRLASETIHALADQVVKSTAAIRAIRGEIQKLSGMPGLPAETYAKLREFLESTAKLPGIAA